MDGEELDVKGAFSSLQSGRKKDTMGEKARPFPALGKGRILRQGVCFMARRTQAVIMQAFMDLLTRKPLDKITVKDIIEEADINRNTFYYYYENIPDLLDAYFAYELQKFSESTEKSDSFAREYNRACASLLENRRAIHHIYLSENRELISNYLKKASQLFVERFVREAAEPYHLSEAGIDYVMHLYAYSVLGVTMRWIQQNVPVDPNLPELLESTFHASVDGIIQDYIAFFEKHPTEQ